MLKVLLCGLSVRLILMFRYRIYRLGVDIPSRETICEGSSPIEERLIEHERSGTTKMRDVNWT